MYNETKYLKFLTKHINSSGDFTGSIYEVGNNRKTRLNTPFHITILIIHDELQSFLFSQISNLFMKIKQCRHVFQHSRKKIPVEINLSKYQVFKCLLPLISGKRNICSPYPGLSSSPCPT